MVSSRPPADSVTVPTEALVMVWSSRPSNGRWPGLSGFGKRRTSIAISCAPRFTEVTPRKSPGLMSVSAIGCVNTISVWSPMVILSSFCNVRVPPSNAATVPRTRVCAWAAVPRTSNASSSALVRRLDAIFAYVKALDHDPAVGFLARVGPDGFARLEVGARAGHEGDDRRARRHQHGLRAALVVERDLVAAARLRQAVEVGVGHGRVRLQVPGEVPGLRLRRDRVHLERLHLAVAL